LTGLSSTSCKTGFPVETKAKLKANEREAAEEELQEFGIDPMDVS